MNRVKKKLKKINWIYTSYKKYKYRFYFDKSAKLYYPENKHNKEKVAIVLAGYKEQLWKVFFERLKLFLPSDYDVCIVSSGKNSKTLKEISKKNGWSYLPTRKNNVCLALNTAISRYDNAEYILKIDEDIFIAKHTIEEMENAYSKPVIDYIPGVVAPLIPINGFGYVEVLKIFNKLNAYESKFGRAIHGAGADKEIENNPDVAKFFWNTNNLAKLDELDSYILKEKKEQVACPIRFSIGIIYFEKKLWTSMNYLKVDPRSNDMGQDEEQLDKYCFINSRPIVVSKNAIAGHLSFGRQNSSMYKFFDKNIGTFEV